jgi:hypothetical protein
MIDQALIGDRLSALSPHFNGQEQRLLTVTEAAVAA